MEFYTGKIISQKKVAPEIYLLEVASMQQTVVPGQFFMLKSWANDLPLMRPVSLYKANQNSLSFLYRIVGDGTRRLASRKKGDQIEILGPLGNGFPVDKVTGKIALVGGGLGIPPMYEAARQLKVRGQSVDLFLGYRKELFVLNDFVEICDNIFIASEYGSEGYKGFVTDLLKCHEYDAVFTCGPESMMFKIVNLCRDSNVPVWVSMEKRMGCGIGACLVCTCETQKGMSRSCYEGPVFNGYNLIIPE